MTTVQPVETERETEHTTRTFKEITVELHLSCLHLNIHIVQIARNAKQSWKTAENALYILLLNTKGWTDVEGSVHNDNRHHN